jgi:hypothetical protein
MGGAANYLDSSTAELRQREFFPNGSELIRASPMNFVHGCSILGDVAAFRLAQRLPLRPVTRCAMQYAAVDNFSDWVRLIESEFAEMPGLHLSKRQAQRLWNLDPCSTDIIFDALEASSFLKRTPNDMYIRADIRY